MIKLCSAMLLAAACATAAYADASLYLYPRAELKAGGIAFSDVAIIQSDPATAEKIRGAVVGDALIADGYLDESEIRQALAGLVEGRLSIYGTGVRVAGAPKGAAAEAAPAAVKKGAPVRFHVIHSGISVEMAGTALRDGSVGDVIPVKLKGNAVSNGTIINEHVVELQL
jgi:hypothetical protein